MTIQRRFAALPMLVAFIAVAVFVSSGFAAKAPSPTLSVSLSSAAGVSGSMPYGTPYVVSGCGYSAANGGVTIVVRSPQATAFAGQIPDANGCISVSNFSTQGAGSYNVSAYQQAHNKSSLLAQTSFTLS
jgi:hypothetical protein